MEKSKQAETLLSLVLGLVVLYWVKRWDGWLLLALGIGVAGLLVPPMARVLDWGWRRLALLLGKVSSTVLLSLVYFLILFPLSFIARRSGRSGVRRKAGGVSYFSDRNHTYDKEDLTHPW